MAPHRPRLASLRPHVTMPEEACVDNAADAEIVGIAYAPTMNVANLLEEGARVLFLARVAKEPTYVALPRQTLAPSTIPLRPP